MNLKTNVEKDFLRLIDTAFPPQNPLHKLFTRQTVKLSYRCMPNVARAISRHNSKVLKGDQQTQQPTGCNCAGGAANCPVQGECKTKCVVYKASIRETVSGKTETYTGLTSRTFKQRYNEHCSDTRNLKIQLTHMGSKGQGSEPRDRMEVKRQGSNI